MPALVVPNAALARLIWTSGGTPFQINVIGYAKSAALVVDQALADALSTAWKAAFTSSGYAALVPTTIALAQVALRDISQPNRPEFIGAGTPTAGTAAAGKRLPPQTALCVTLRTALAGKSFRGRVYLGGWHDTANQADGTASAAATTAARSFVNSSAPPAGLTLAVVSRKLLTATAIQDAQVRDAQWDTIRRRATPGI